MIDAGIENDLPPGAGSSCVVLRGGFDRGEILFAGFFEGVFVVGGLTLGELERGGFTTGFLATGLDSFFAKLDGSKVFEGFNRIGSFSGSAFASGCGASALATVVVLLFPDFFDISPSTVAPINATTQSPIPTAVVTVEFPPAVFF